jgi:hypothetical protein
VAFSSPPLHVSGGVLFKVYVIGHMVRVVRRFSLPDIVGNGAETNDIVSFPRVSCAAASADDVDLDPSIGGTGQQPHLLLFLCILFQNSVYASVRILLFKLAIRLLEF